MLNDLDIFYSNDRYKASHQTIIESKAIVKWLERPKEVMDHIVGV